MQITTPATLPAGTEGVPYSINLAATGGKAAAYVWSLTSVSPSAPWLSVSPAGDLGGAPLRGTYSITVQLTDSIGTIGQVFTLVISPPPLIVTTPSLPAGEATAAYPPPTGAGVTLTATGGTPPYTWALANTSAPLPANLSISTTGVISGTLAATATTVSNIIVQVTDVNSVSATSQALTLTVNPAPSITTVSPLPQGEVTAAYDPPNGVTLSATGGSGSGYTFALATGTTLPPGLQLSAGVISGTPTASGPFNFTLRVTDSAGGSSTKDFTVTVTAAPVITTTSPLPQGEMGAVYQQVNLSATGGSGSGYTFALANATSMPPGLLLSNAGAITGTPIAPGTFNFTVKVTDSAGGSSTQNFAVTIISGPSITNGPTLPSGTVNVVYSGVTLTGSDGTAPYTWSITVGALPALLTLNGSTGAITGTPTAQGTFNFTAQVTDAKGVTGSKQFTITIASGLIITNPPTLPTGEVNVPYSQTFTAAGGTPSYTWSTIGGALPGGLGLNSATGVLGGPPNGSGTFNFTVQVRDANGVTASQQFTLTIAPQLAIDTAPNLPGGSAGTLYSQAISASGGVTPYSWSTISGALPGGLSLNPSSGVISGTPTTAGTFNFTAQVTDRASVSANKQFTLQVTSGLVISTPSTLPSGSIGASYSQFLFAAGGTQPYRWSVSAGSLPAGLNLFAANGGIAGTPTSAGTYTFTLQVIDNASVTAHKDFTLTIAAGLVIATPSALPDGVVGKLYSQPLTAAGGSTPYHWQVVAGTIPPDLILNPATGVISGTPTTGGNFNFGVQVTDNASANSTKNFTISIASGLVITTTSLPGSTVGATYSQTLVVNGGKPPYAWSISAGAMAPGLSLSASDGTITGSPNKAGTFTFTVEVSDSASATAMQPLSITITPSLSITTADPLPGATVGAAYSVTLIVSGGQSPYTWSIISGSLPQGLTLDPSTGIIQGKPTAGGNFSLTIQVVGGVRTTATKNFKLAVGVAKPPDMTVTGLPATLQAAQQVSFNLTLASGYPLDITGRATLAFQADAAAPADDPAIQFSTGGRTVDFTIPANATTAVFPGGQISMQTGTVSGSIHLSFALKAAGADLAVTGLDQSLTIARSAPVIQRVDVQRSGTTIQISVVAFSTPRELTQAHLVFTPTPGSNLQTTDVVEKLNDPAAQWYGSATSVQYGGQVLVVFGFTASQGSVNTVQSVSVTLTNSQGNSQAVSATF